MPRVHHVQKARKARPEHDIDVGDEYYWWQFRFGGKRFSKKYPKRQQLTQSDYLIQRYNIEDAFSEIDQSSIEDAVSSLQSIQSDIETLRDEQEEKRSSMPEHLQDVGSGELLQERYDELETLYDEFQTAIDELEDQDDNLSPEEIEEAIGCALSNISF